MIHKFTFDGLNVVLDVNSGAVHVMDDLAFALLEDYPELKGEELVARYRGRFPEPEIREALAEIDELVREGLLFSRDVLAGSYAPPEGLVKAMCLHLAHDCNLRCRYCFAGQGDFGGSRGLMSPEVGRRALELLLELSGSRRHVEVDFFGGEPLLNFATMKELVEYGRKRADDAGKEIKFTVTTNAVLLNDRVGDYLRDNGFFVVLSLDGRPEVHDRMRTRPNGRGSYRHVVENVLSFFEAGGVPEYYVRGTFTRYNLDFAEDVRHMVELGFDNVSVEPVVAPPEEDYALREEDVPRILEEYERLTRMLLELYRSGRRVHFFHFEVDLEGGPCLLKRLTGCGAGFQYVAVDPAGKIYPCHQLVGREEFLIGDVWEGIENTEVVNLFREAHVYNKEDCMKCWARFFCSGGCQANNYNFSGSIYKPHDLSCALMRKRLECAIYLQIKLAGLA